MAFNLNLLALFMVVKGPERPDIIGAVKLLRSTRIPLFVRIAKLLLLPTRRRIETNIKKIAKFSKAGDIVVVPGKVLGEGMIDHAVEVVALSFSTSAKTKIERAGGHCRDFAWLIKRGAKDVKLLR